MALDAQQSNFVSELMNMAALIVDNRDEWQLLRSRWSVNGFNGTIIDVNITGSPGFAHLTEQEIKRALSVLDLLVALLDTDTSIGGQAAINHLIRLKG